jgi:hypothetical protein
MEKNNTNKGKLIISKEQYDRIFASGLINESSIPKSPKVTGGLNRVDIAFKKATSGKQIKESSDILKNETIELIKYLYRESKDFSSFWGDHDLSYDDICDALLSKKLIVKNEGKFEVSKSLGDPEAAKKAIEDELRAMVGEIKPIEEYDNYPMGANNDPNAPWNRDDSNYREGNKSRNDELDVLAYNREIAILKAKDNSLYVFYYIDLDRNEFKDYADLEVIDTYPDGEGGYDVDYSDDFEIDAEVLENYVNDNLTPSEAGNGTESWEDGEIFVKIDDSLKAELANLYDKDQQILKVLGSVNEYDDHQVGMDTMDKFKSGLQRAFTPVDKGEKSPEEQSRILAKLKDIRDKELARREIEKNTEIDETSTTGSVGGSFVAPMGSEVIKRNTKEVPVVKETMTATPQTVGAYDANALPGINRDGSFKNAKKPKAFDKTQYAGGGFVKLDDCTKLNNNKTAQKGGCSTGAIDKVVKVKQSKGNISAPSLNEGMMREALKLQHDKTQNSLIVVSDLEGRQGSQETFKNKAVLKQSGFIWSGTNWVIPVDKLDIAKKTLSLVNKAEYLIDTLEDLEAAVEDSAADNKSLLKSRLDQYISDLANATDEKALSAEIRRYLTFFSKFHSYSFYNRMLIFIQRPEATKVASYKLWQSKFRQVKKGAKAITVLAPAGKPEMTQYDDETAELMGQIGVTNKPQITRFRAVNVFDISDTEPIDERGEVPDSPQWWGDNTPSETADVLFGAVSEVASDMGINVTQSDAKGGEKGFSAGDHINISSDVSGAARLSTMIHEIAHELMHWKKSSIYFIDNGEGKQKAELQELQAESVSYVVLKHYGIPVSHHATYLVLWKANKERIQNNLEIISKVSQFLITKIDEQVSNGNK